MSRFAAVLLGACLLAACDTAPEAPVEPSSLNTIAFENGLKPRDVTADSYAQMMVCGADRGAPDTLVKMGQGLASRRARGYMLGYWHLFFSKRGTALVPLHYGYRADNATLPHETWHSVLSDRQHDAGVAHLRLDTTARNVAQIQRFDPVSGRLSGTFEATLVFFSGSPTPHPARNFPDTVHMRNGTFDVTPKVIPCIR